VDHTGGCFRRRPSRRAGGRHDRAADARGVAGRHRPDRRRRSLNAPPGSVASASGLRIGLETPRVARCAQMVPLSKLGARSGAFPPWRRCLLKATPSSVREHSRNQDQLSNPWVRRSNYVVITLGFVSTGRRCSAIHGGATIGYWHQSALSPLVETWKQSLLLDDTHRAGRSDECDRRAVKRRRRRRSAPANARSLRVEAR
jgi:hypothetical protein